MPKLYVQFLLVIVCLSACSTIQYVPQQPMDAEKKEITDQTFYDALEPNGRWICDTLLGYAWNPNVGADFRPYITNGHWTYTNDGWTWISDFNWGWAAFHYGRWKTDSTYGWLWVPGHEWAPAWVQWRQTPDAYGWAPLQPIIQAKADSLTDNSIPDKSWAFVPKQHFGDSSFSEYLLPVQRNNVYANRSITVNNTIRNLQDTNGNNTVFIAGPEINNVRNISAQHIRTHQIVNQTEPGLYVVNNNVVTAFRPTVKAQKDFQQLSFAPKTWIAPPPIEIKPIVVIEPKPQKKRAPIKKWNVNNMPKTETASKSATNLSVLQTLEETSISKVVKE